MFLSARALMPPKSRIRVIIIRHASHIIWPKLRKFKMVARKYEWYMRTFGSYFSTYWGDSLSPGPPEPPEAEYICIFSLVSVIGKYTCYNSPKWLSKCRSEESASIKFYFSRNSNFFVTSFKSSSRSISWKMSTFFLFISNRFVCSW